MTGPAHRGRYADAYVDRVFHAAARKGVVADLQRISAETVVDEGEVRFVNRTHVNYVGWMLDGSGRFVAEDVVATDARTPEAFYLRRLPEHRYGYLRRCHTAGGVAVLTIVWGDALWGQAGAPPPRVAVIDWPALSACLDTRTHGPKIVLAELPETTPESYLTRFVRRPS